jgi:hypothetical protein
MKQLIAAATLLAGIAFGSTAYAAGAVAIAEPADVAEDGYAAGIAYRHKTQSDAEERAMRECQSVEDAPPSTRKLCRIVRTFEDQCAAIALDPKAGTPGAGWAVADSLADARTEATRRCEATAGAKRQGECRVTAEGCDGKAK